MGRRWASVAGATVAAGLAAGFGYLAVTAGTPPTPDVPTPALPQMLVIEPGVVDLGSVRQNQTLDATAKVVNRTATAVDILIVSKSCSCTDAEVDRKHLEPNEAAVLSLGWRTGSKRGPVSDRVTIIARTVGGVPRQLSADFHLKANVQPDVIVEPAAVTIVAGKRSRHEVRFTFAGCPAGSITATHSLTQGVTASFTAGKTILELNYNPLAEGSPAKSNVCVISYTCNGQGYYELSINFVQP